MNGFKVFKRRLENALACRNFALVLMVCLGLACEAADTPHELATPELKQRYQVLLEELRCLVCQNQSLADSHADLAQDLRNEVHRMLNENYSDDAIRDFMVERYGDFVLYKPPIKPSTMLLWFGPFALIIFAILMLWRNISGRRDVTSELSAEEKAYALNLRAANNPGETKAE